MSRQRLFLFAYDISDDRKRLGVARRLEDVGVRVQESVFELRCSQEAAHALAEQLRPLIDKGDSLRVYFIPDRALQHALAIGGAPIPEPGNYLLF